MNTARFVDAHDTIEDPYLRDLVRVLLSDEMVHGQFGFQYLELVKEWLEEREDVRVSLRRYLAYAFAILERTMSGAGAPKRTLSDDERALGIPDPARHPEIFYQTITAAVIPGLERFGIDAGTAWKERAARRA